MDFNDKTALAESGTDSSFIKSINEFILSEKQQLCSEERADQHYIYSTAFNKVIDYATVYRPILTAIKKEYDDIISALKNNERKVQIAHEKAVSMLAQPTSLMYYQKRAVQLQERIAIIERNTTELQAKLEELERMQDLQQQDSFDDQAPGQIPGLSVSKSLSPAALLMHLQDLKHEQAKLLSKIKTHYVPMQLKTDLDNKIKTTMNQRDELAIKSHKLQLRNKQLNYLTASIKSWEILESRPPLLEFLTSELEHISNIKVCDDDFDNIDTDESEEIDPAKIKESKLLVEYIKRFDDLFKAGEYAAAAFHAAKSSQGVLREMETLERFKSVTEYEGELPPVLLFFRALILTQPEKQIPGKELSLEGTRCALQHGYIELVAFGVTQHRLTYSEELGDILCNHGDEDPRIMDTCLALAYIVYLACCVLRKAALSMCKRGLTRAAVEFMHCNKIFTVDDCMFVVRACPSLSLLRELTQQSGRKPAMMSVGFVCHTLLNTDQEDLTFQLLEEIHTAGKGDLEKTILNDEMCGAESWNEIATHCKNSNRPQLAQEISSTLLCQPGIIRLSPDIESAKLMEHVFM
ncbi:clathrin heavy chain linker domain-containing protein 1-like [Trichomycterus rosablanca]|uniref:clathrin heavy chain linker domain-containing protein 1-like n=1 Tax=Trichomycterus rosablanca TaxID=2290929 RepID=UPI002F3590F1